MRSEDEIREELEHVRSQEVDVDKMSTFHMGEVAGYVLALEWVLALNEDDEP